MPVYASDNGGDFEKAPTGMQQAVCVFVHYIGFQKSDFQGKETINEKVIVSWELAERMKEGSYAGQPFIVNKWYTLSLNEKSNLRKDLESWRGQPFTQDELKRFDLENLVGANCFLNLTETSTGNRKIAAITPLPKGITRIERFNLKPSEKFAEWIEKERSKSLHPVTTSPEVGPETNPLPF